MDKILAVIYCVFSLGGAQYMHSEYFSDTITTSQIIEINKSN